MRPFIETLPGSRIYACASCGLHVSTRSDLISKTFHGRCGRAFLFERAVNVETPVLEDRALMTGLHSVADAHCTRCGNYLGWVYIWAQEPSQQYKVGKVILEREKLSKLLWAR